MGEFPMALELAEEEADQRWKSTGVLSPDFFVLDDKMNDERYIYVEASSAHFSERWIASVVKCLGASPGWGVGITNLKNGYLIILENILLVNGPIFDGADTIRMVVEVARDNLQ